MVTRFLSGLDAYSRDTLLRNSRSRSRFKVAVFHQACLSVQLPITLRRTNRTVALGKVLRFGSVTDRTTKVKTLRRKPRYQVLHFAALPRLHFRTYPSLRGQLPSTTCLILSPFSGRRGALERAHIHRLRSRKIKDAGIRSVFGHPQVTQLVSDRLREVYFFVEGPELAWEHNHPALVPTRGCVAWGQGGIQATTEDEDRPGACGLGVRPLAGAFATRSRYPTS
ncbi:hypothetical protein F4860DRAFT_196754 [Xylaria cubensis]|nr:hypothetical protein F4860DRAFT_196754 [Xylaria cubensis]